MGAPESSSARKLVIKGTHATRSSHLQSSRSSRMKGSGYVSRVCQASLVNAGASLTSLTLVGLSSLLTAPASCLSEMPSSERGRALTRCSSRSLGKRRLAHDRPGKGSAPVPAITKRASAPSQATAPAASESMICAPLPRSSPRRMRLVPDGTPQAHLDSAFM